MQDGQRISTRLSYPCTQTSMDITYLWFNLCEEPRREHQVEMRCLSCFWTSFIRRTWIQHLLSKNWVQSGKRYWNDETWFVCGSEVANLSLIWLRQPLMEIVIKTASDCLTMANDTSALSSRLARRRLQDSVPVTVFPVNIDEKWDTSNCTSTLKWVSTFDGSRSSRRVGHFSVRHSVPELGLRRIKHHLWVVI